MKAKMVFAEKYGLCTGVARALALVNQALVDYKVPIYVYHEIVHNNFVIQELIESGVIFVDNLDHVPDGNVVIFSAHGVGKDIEKLASLKQLKVIDASCPLVKKNHQIIEDAELNGDTILFVGNRNHAEVIGCQNRISKLDKFFIIESDEDIGKIPEDLDGVTLLTQTTWSIEETQRFADLLMGKFPQLKNLGGICHATNSRQKAIKKLAEKVDLILVVGSPKSSNSKQLVKIANALGVDAFLIENVADLVDINFDKYQKIGISAGASTPSSQIEKIVAKLDKC